MALEEQTHFVSEEQYLTGREDRLGASEIDNSGRYNACFKLGHAATADVQPADYAERDYVQVQSIDRDGADFALTLSSVDSDATRTARVSLNGIVYSPGSTPEQGEQGYLLAPTPDEWDDELEDLTENLREPLERKKPTEEKKQYMHAPLPTYQPRISDNNGPKRKFGF